MVKKAVLGLVALAVALSFSPVLPLQAAGPMGPGSRIHADSVVDVVKGKKKVKKAKKAKKAKVAKKKPKKAKKAKKASVAFKTCGTYKYWNVKTKKCADKRG